MSALISSPYSSPHLLQGNSPQVSDSISLNFSLDKRPSSAPSNDEPSPKKTKFTDIRIDRIRNTRLVSFSIRESSAGSYATSAERLAAATRLAAEFDNDLDLPPSTSHIPFSNLNHNVICKVSYSFPWIKVTRCSLNCMSSPLQVKLHLDYLIFRCQ